GRLLRLRRSGMQRASIAFCCVVALLVSSRRLDAQTATGAILGTVRDEKGAVVPGVTVTATQMATNVRRQTVSTDAGNYSFPLLPAAIYAVSAELTGFKRTTLENVELQVGQTARVDLVLQIGQLTEQVTVTGGAP